MTTLLWVRLPLVIREPSLRNNIPEFSRTEPWASVSVDAAVGCTGAKLADAEEAILRVEPPSRRLVPPTSKLLVTFRVGPMSVPPSSICMPRTVKVPLLIVPLALTIRLSKVAGFAAVLGVPIISPFVPSSNSRPATPPVTTHSGAETP
jgi:hypothetical protein